MHIHFPSRCSSSRLEPPVMTAWVNYQESLTDKLDNLTGHAQVELLNQQWTSSNWWDRQFLSLEKQAVFLREILMKSHGTVYWYARSIIPKTCYELNSTFFDRLQHESIKNLIFDEPLVTRVNSSSYIIDRNSIEWYWLKLYCSENYDSLWLRLFEYSFNQQGSFYLIEILFPELGSVDNCSTIPT